MSQELKNIFDNVNNLNDEDYLKFTRWVAWVNEDNSRGRLAKVGVGQ